MDGYITDAYDFLLTIVDTSIDLRHIIQSIPVMIDPFDCIHGLIKSAVHRFA